MDDERIAKLPAWARNMIARLQGDLNDAREKLGVSEEETEVFIVDYVQGNRPLPADSIVSFKIGENDTIQVGARAGVLHLHGAQALAVAPLFANALDVHLAPREW